jgi:hypothetical protein
MTVDYLTNILQTNLFAILRGEPCLAALVHSTDDDVATRVALRALTGMAEIEIRLVEEIDDHDFDFDGLFFYDSTAVAGSGPGEYEDDGKDYILPDSGPGVWLRYQTITTQLAWGKSADLGGHVFTGISQILSGSRNRGRMPFVEFDIDAGTFDDFTTSGGETDIGVNIRCWYTNNRDDAGTKSVRQMALRVARAVRNWFFNTSGVGYAPGIGTGTLQRIYSNTKVEIQAVERASGFAYCDMRLEIPMTYSEQTLV